jgi:D-alanyl-lipoteichoic acid acyltransferase DltB (MBOAT superfamily)
MSDLGVVLAVALASLAAVFLSWLAPARLRLGAIALCGAILLALVSPLSLGLMLGSGALAWIAARQGGVASRLAMVLIAAAYLAWLAWAGQTPGRELTPMVPFAMAYAVLRLIHYLAETERGRLRAHDPVQYAAWLLFPPALAVGPIHRFDEFLRDLHRRRWDPVLFSEGLGRILQGLIKIVLIGNYLIGIKFGPMILTATTGDPFGEAWGRSLVFWLNLFAQFSGCSDVAIGFGALMGFRLRENFVRPWMARNIGDFWQRWHLSLSSWCRDYVYMPLAAWTRQPLIAVAGSMVALGLWHAVSLHYLLWGLYHAVGIAVWRSFHARSQPLYKRLPAPLRWAWTAAAVVLTLNFVILSFPATHAVEALLRSL